MKASDVAIMIYHPHIRRRAGKQGAPSSAAEIVVDSNSDDDDEPTGGDAAKADAMRRQHSGGSVKVEDGEKELSTHEAIELRNALELPALAAAVTLEVSLGHRNHGIMGRRLLPSCLPVCMSVGASLGESARPISLLEFRVLKTRQCAR